MPAVTVIHETLLDAVHAQPDPAVTVIVPVAGAAPMEVLVGEIENVQGTGGSWVTVNVRPAIVTVPVRCVVPVYAATEYPTVPVPEPLVPDVIVIHDVLLDAVQAQPVFVVTVTEPVEPLAETVVAVGEMEKLQPVLWVTVNVCPAIVSVPVRWLVVELAATEYVTDPLPAPFAPEVIVNHDALLAAVHAHPVTADTLTVPVDAVALTDTLVGEMAELHGDENANVFDSRLRPTPAGPTAATRAS